jgi:hypothetical protein
MSDAQSDAAESSSVEDVEPDSEDGPGTAGMRNDMVTRALSLGPELQARVLYGRSTILGFRRSPADATWKAGGSG